IMFALYGLPPILRAIYGEEDVAAGETYDGDGRVLRVLSVERQDDPALFVVTMEALTSKSWDLETPGIKLEVTTQDEWIEALPPDPSQPDTSFDFTLGQQRVLELRF